MEIWVILVLFVLVIIQQVQISYSVRADDVIYSKNPLGWTRSLTNKIDSIEYDINDNREKQCDTKGDIVSIERDLDLIRGYIGVEKTYTKPIDGGFTLTKKKKGNK